MVKNLKKLRAEYGISQQQLADVIGVSRQSINKYENHNVEPDIETLGAMADYFNVSIDYLVGHDNARSSDTDTAALLRIFNLMSPKQKELYMDMGKTLLRSDKRD